MVMDFDELLAKVRTAVVDVLDHRHLNDLVENPTCERLLAWMWAVLDAKVVGLDELTLWETSTSRASFRRSR